VSPNMFATDRRSRIGLGLLWLCGIFFAIGAAGHFLEQRGTQEPLFDNDPKPLLSKPESGTLHALLEALDVIQGDYFAIWQGIWPTSIDWTSAVIGTYLSASLSTLSTSFPEFSSSRSAENLVNKYFSQLSASYFGQDAFSLRQEAYDDMLWVVLGWLESIKFIQLHSETHYAEAENAGSWYGKEWIPSFAHRARIFWEMASQGWDTELCDGGMIWSPYLVPYKNAITNELFIAASISMYLYFPGDDNSSPFGFSAPKFPALDNSARARDPKYLAASIEAYKWLLNSNMTNTKGLFVDGYHISGWSRERPDTNYTGNTRCDARNEMVYTYNQGVLLSGQRGLYEATGARSYLEDGHRLVSDVIAATGWDLKRGNSLDFLDEPEWPGRKFGRWHGLGRSGILEEACDAPGYCSQDSQTFKGIFFHHLALFCARLPDHLTLDGVFIGKDVNSDPSEIEAVRKWHDQQCARYGPWIKHNAKAALTTVDTKGRFGMWWGAPPHTTLVPDVDVDLPAEAVDYRNHKVPQQWKYEPRHQRDIHDGSDDMNENSVKIGILDLNDRGRGRTVETQGGGVSVLRALWEIVDTR
jgi:hypothetical protein